MFAQSVGHEEDGGERAEDADAEEGGAEGTVTHEEHAEVAGDADQEPAADEELGHGGVHEGLAAVLEEVVGVLAIVFPTDEGEENEEDAADGDGRGDEVQVARDQGGVGEVVAPAGGGGEILAAHAWGLHEGDVGGLDEADDQDQHQAGEKDDAGGAGAALAVVGDEVEAVVGDDEQDEEKEPGPRDEDGGGVEVLAVDGLHEEEGAMPMVMVAARKWGFSWPGRGRCGCGTLMGVVKRAKRAREGAAEHEVHGEDVEEEGDQQQRLEEPIGCGERVGVDGWEPCWGRSCYLPPSVRGWAGWRRAARVGAGC